MVYPFTNNSGHSKIGLGYGEDNYIGIWDWLLVWTSGLGHYVRLVFARALHIAYSGARGDVEVIFLASRRAQPLCPDSKQVVLLFPPAECKRNTIIGQEDQVQPIAGQERFCQSL